MPRVQIDRNSGPFLGAGVNEVSVRNANDPMPTGQGEIGTVLLSPFEDRHYRDTLCYYLASHLVP